MRYKNEKKRRSFKWFYVLVILVFVGWIMMSDYGVALFEDEVIELNAN